MLWAPGDRIVFDRDGERGRVWSVQSIDTEHEVYILSGPSVIVPLGLFITEVDTSGWWRAATDEECDAQLAADTETNTRNGWAVTRW